MSCRSDDHNKKGDMLRYYKDQIEQHDEQRIKDKIVRGLDEKPRYVGEKISFVGAFHTEEPQLLYGGARRNGKTTAIFEWAKAMYALNVTLKKELAQVKKERDAAVADVKSLCATNYFSGDFCVYCKYREPDGQCFHDCTPYSSKWGWEWRGVQEE